MAESSISDIQIDDGNHEQGKSIKLHPLAIVGISDHHTRVAVGGSHMAKDAPLVGLLFGQHNGDEISILDAQEMEFSFAASPVAAEGKFGGGSQEEQTQHKASLETKIELHKKVFKDHEVLGWYHVHPHNEATTTDSTAVHMSGMIREYIHESCSDPLFLWMHPDPGSGNGRKTQKEFPIRIYESVAVIDAQQPHRRAKFLPLEFEVNTGEPERIAVEKAISDQPTAGGANNGLDIQIQTLESCIKSLISRLDVLLQYVQSVENNQSKVTCKTMRTLRQIDSILSQLPVFLSYRNLENPNASFTSGYEDVLTISYLAAVNKSTNTLRKLADKIRLVQEGANKGSNTSKQSSQIAGAASGRVSVGGQKHTGTVFKSR